MSTQPQRMTDYDVTQERIDDVALANLPAVPGA
jgi:hypothetical protein